MDTIKAVAVQEIRRVWDLRNATLQTSGTSKDLQASGPHGGALMLNFLFMFVVPLKSFLLLSSVPFSNEPSYAFRSVLQLLFPSHFPFDSQVTRSIPFRSLSKRGQCSQTSASTFCLSAIVARISQRPMHFLLVDVTEGGSFVIQQLTSPLRFPSPFCYMKSSDLWSDT